MSSSSRRSKKTTASAAKDTQPSIKITFPSPTKPANPSPSKSAIPSLSELAHDPETTINALLLLHNLQIDEGQLQNNVPQSGNSGDRDNSEVDDNWLSVESSNYIDMKTD